MHPPHLRCVFHCQPGNVQLSPSGDVKIANFYSACELSETADLESTFWHPGDKLEYRAPEDVSGSFSFASDMFSVGVTLFEMATGKLPDTSLDRDQLLATIDDPAKHELISFALHDQPSKRPTAEELLQHVTLLAPASILDSEFRAQVFASMRFSAHGPEAEAKLLRGKLASQGVHLHIISLLAGESITRSVFDTMATCDAFVALATIDYGQSTGNPAATDRELAFWQTAMMRRPGKSLLPVRMIPWEAEFDHLQARVM